MTATYNHSLLAICTNKTFIENGKTLLYAGPLISELQVYPIPHTSSIQLLASLNYTGGGLIQYFMISFREAGVGDWMDLGSDVPAMAVNDSVLLWTALVVSDKFQESPVELQVQAVNSNGYISNSVYRRVDNTEQGSITTTNLMIGEFGD